jgi:hypothetical protein
VEGLDFFARQSKLILNVSLQPAGAPDDSGLQECVREKTGVPKYPGPCKGLPKLDSPPLPNVVCALGNCPQSSAVLATP